MVQEFAFTRSYQCQCNRRHVLITIGLVTIGVAKLITTDGNTPR